MKPRDMTFLAHFEELRKRLIIIAIFLVLGLVIGFFLAPTVIDYLQSIPEAEDFPMNAFQLTDPLQVYINFAFFISIILILPVIFYQLWAFISPGLAEKERKVTLSYIPMATVLFLAGIAFSYYVLLPYIMSFLGTLAERLNITEQYGINEYFSFLFRLTLPFGFLFQLPVAVMFFTRLGLMTPMLLHRIRKYAYFGLLVVAGFITPPELVTHLMVTLPLFLLYELSVVISRYAYRKRMKEEAARQRAMVESQSKDQ
ncbi:sec-independent protein translocase protein TatC [Geomicrobium halophilum]|uniref:Sec-independent protein translocase protein TatC n=1 Tax=Geomicrobium halophilum TaxID=549000 RepID=A0A841PTB5_9BACL|nr:twin-arginine translocase subunit TatC [Geomicrobium halophilum]MBB6451014.1 sec-independent protein translocase protein TatC [Geomicrobium halophilum]